MISTGFERAGGGNVPKQEGRALLRTTLASAVAILLALTVGLWLYSRDIARKMERQVLQSLQDVAAQNVLVIQREIEGKFQLMKTTAQRFDGDNGVTDEFLLARLRSTVELYDMKRMGIAEADGKARTTDSETLDIGTRLYFRQSMTGKTVITDTMVDMVDGLTINVYSTPVYGGGTVKRVLFATYDTEHLRTLLDVPCFSGEGFSYIVDKNGDVVAAPRAGMDNVFTEMGGTGGEEQARAAVAQMRRDFSAGASNSVRYGAGGQERCVYYTPLQINDWYLLTAVPGQVLNERITPVLRVTDLICVLVALVFLLGAGRVVYSQYRAKQQVERLAYVDPLTGGYSAVRFQMLLPQQLAKNPGPAAFAVMDLDNFRMLNDVYGTAAGDDMLRAVWAAWRACLGPEELVTHRTADRFMILLFYRDEGQLRGRLQDFYTHLRAQAKNLDAPVPTPSIGVYPVPRPAPDMEVLYGRAAMARDTVKGNRRRIHAFYSEEMKAREQEDQAMANAMDDALKNGEFAAWYQPKYDAVSQCIVGAEALVRWQKPDGTLILPGRFIPLFEKNSAVTALDEAMFDNVLRQQLAWREQGMPLLPISVNLSRAHLGQTSFIRACAKKMEDAGLPVSCIQFELTESAAMDRQQMSETLRELHVCGFTVLLDDYGTGYSSLQALEQLYFDVMKLDKSFVDEIGTLRGEAVLHSTIALAQALGMKTVAEGVETQAQYEFLRAAGCDEIQGFYFAQPMPADQFLSLRQADKATV